jgi:hypothetical protein
VSRRRPTYGPIPIQYRQEDERLVILTVGVLALLVGALLVVGVAVTL